MTDIEMKILDSNISAQIKGAFIAPLVLAGSPGTGKSSTVKQICTDANLALVNVSAGTVQPETLGGIPNFKKAHEMDKYSTIGNKDSEATRWSVPELIEQANSLAEIGNGVVILIDDFHELNMATESYMLEFLLERKLGQYKLAKNVAIVGTMNSSDEANFNGMSSAVRNRLAILEVEFSFEYWFENYGKFLHFYLSSFSKTHSSYINEEETTGVEGFGTPRAYEFLSETFKSLDRDFVVDNVQKLAKQYVSNAASTALNKHVVYMEKIDFIDKIKNKVSIDVSSLKPIDQILHAYIIHYIDTVEDAEYLINIINNNSSEENFIGFIVGEMAIKYKMLETDASSQPVGIKVLIDKLLEENTFTDLGLLSAEELNMYNNIKFKDRQPLVKIAMDFL